jgi:hypothetical protein
LFLLLSLVLFIIYFLVLLTKKFLTSISFISFYFFFSSIFLFFKVVFSITSISSFILCFPYFSLFFSTHFGRY